jgi:hypothetical protein
VVEKNTVITYYKSNIYEMVEPFCLYHPVPLLSEEGTTGSDFSPTIFCPPAKKGFYSNVLFKMT